MNESRRGKSSQELLPQGKHEVSAQRDHSCHRQSTCICNSLLSWVQPSLPLKLTKTCLIFTFISLPPRRASCLPAAERWKRDRAREQFRSLLYKISRRTKTSTQKVWSQNTFSWIRIWCAETFPAVFFSFWHYRSTKSCALL